MALSNAGPLLVGELLVLLVMAVIGVDDVAELAELILQVNGSDFGIVEVCSCNEERPESARVPRLRGSKGKGSGKVKGYYL